MVNIGDLTLPPHSNEAEEYFISCLILDINILNETSLFEDDFYSFENKKIFKIISDKKSSEIPVLTDGMGSDFTDYIYKLAGVAYQSTNWREYQTIIKDNSYRRFILRKSQFLEGLSRDGDLNQIETEIKDITSFNFGEAQSGYVTSDIICNTVDGIFDVNNVTKTGINSIDEIIGGFKRGNLVIIAGRPSMGKSTFMMNIALNIADEKKVSFFTFEMSKEEVTKNIVSNLIGGLDGKDKDTIYDELGGIESDKMNNLKIYDMSGQTENILRLIKQDYYNNGTKTFVIDYLQLMILYGNHTNRHSELGKITGMLKALAQDLKIEIISGAQLSRGVEGRLNKRPMLSDLRECGKIEEDADTVMMLYREKYYDPDVYEEEDLLDVLIIKNRGGKIGNTSLYYDFSKMIIRDNYDL